MWLAKLQRMIKEVPDRFLEPEYLEGKVPPNTEAVGELSSEEKRIFGVVRQMAEMIELETEAHEIMHEETGHSDKSCLEHNIKSMLKEEEQDLIYEILIMSVAERLHMHDSDFVFDGNFIYPVKRPDIDEIRKGFNPAGRIMPPESVDFTPDDFPLDMDPKKMN